ncbi:hypothetical protein E0W68_02200 [Flavobacterium salilacus subsp. salilacus]|uniref:hypothetical protein n=1 Tax=Flavobacterium TaxID=237 RepID=UPI001074A135|nr:MULTISPECIES: hypothetical protein [Flavobacterium]KAF2520054.1 hypothetical protein E0W68_02200 [Flavobacterium salilacus subsp. salilacus]MBE1614030.1 hypothetical protein [Flavobacterium sp. SaA2.13]
MIEITQQDSLLMIVRVHQYYRCKTSFNNFAEATIQLNRNHNTELRIICFEHYSSFLSHLYEYYLSFIEQSDQFKRKGRYVDYPSEKPHIVSDRMFNEEVNKLCRNHKASIERGEKSAQGYTAEYYDCTVPVNFGEHFRAIRNRTNHTSIKRVSSTDISLSKFFKEYHKFILILYYQAGYLWNVNVETFCWLEVKDFADEVNSYINSKIT